MSLIFDDLVKDLKERFIKIAEKYPIVDNAVFTGDNMLMCGYAVFFLKDYALSKHNLKINISKF